MRECEGMLNDIMEKVDVRRSVEMEREEDVIRRALRSRLFVAHGYGKSG